MSYEPISISEGRATFVWPHYSEIDIRAIKADFPTVQVTFRGLPSFLDAESAAYIGRQLLVAADEANGGVVA